MPFTPHAQEMLAGLGDVPNTIAAEVAEMAGSSTDEAIVVLHTPFKHHGAVEAKKASKALGVPFKTVTAILAASAAWHQEKVWS